MSKIHITLVGGQPVPIYLGIKYVNPDIVYYVSSSNTKTNVDKFIEFFPSIKHLPLELDPVNLNEIDMAICQLINEIEPEENDISINLVGGTKTWSLAFYEKFRATKATLMLIDQNNIVWNLRSKESLELSIDMDTILKLNQKIPEYISFDSFDGQDKRVAKNLEKLWLKSAEGKKGNSLTKLTTDTNKGTIHLANGTTPKNNKLDNFQNGTISGYLETADGDRMEVISPEEVILTIKNAKYHFQSKHAFSLVTNTGWFEYKVAEILNRWSHAKRVICNAVIKMDDDNSSLNEIDVIVFTGKKLLFVECKTGISKPTDIDKFANDVRRYGGLGSKSIFITNFRPSKLCEKKMAISKIESFHFINHKNAESELYKKLDMILDTINEV